MYNFQADLIWCDGTFKINISQIFFDSSWAKLNVVYVFKKSRPKSYFLPLKSISEVPSASKKLVRQKLIRWSGGFNCIFAIIFLVRFLDKRLYELTILADYLIV